MNPVVAVESLDAIDLRFVDMSYPSLCIPRVYNDISENTIRQIFDDLDFGKIKRIDIISRRSEKGELFKRVFIHYDKWYWNDNTQIVRKKLILGTLG